VISATPTFIDNKDFRSEPSTRSLAILLDKVDELLSSTLTQANASEGVDGSAANVCRCHTGGSSDGDSVGAALLVLSLERRDDLAEKDGFTGTYERFQHELSRRVLMLKRDYTYQQNP